VSKTYPESKRYRLRENEFLIQEIAEVLDDSHSLGAFKTVVDKIPQQQIRMFLSIIKDTYLTGRIKKSRGAMFISLAKDYAQKNNINVFCKLKFLTFANIFPQAPVGNFFVNYNESARHFVLS
jgi:hypothetical protein